MSLLVVMVELAQAGITISPPSLTLVLDPGQQYTETKTVTIPGGSASTDIDIYFLADTTGSMGSVLANVRSGALNVLSQIQTLVPNARFGVGNYKDFPYDAYAFQHQVSITNNIGAVQAGINAWYSSGGADISEGQFYALDQIADPADPRAIQFRAGSQKVIVWFGDAPSHDPICSAISGLPYSITESSVTQKLVDNGFTVIAISTNTGMANGLNGNPLYDAGNYWGYCTIGGTSGQATRIVTATDGALITNVSPSQIVAAIQAAIQTVVLYVDVSLVPTGDIAPFTEVLTPPYVHVPLPAAGSSLSLTFDVRYTAPPCDPDLEEHVYSGTVDAIVDTALGASQTVTLSEPSCDTPEVLEIGIDIWPFSRPTLPNRIYASKPTRKIPVLILGSSFFDVMNIDFTTVRFGPDGDEAAISGSPQFQDGNYDGVLDVMVNFVTGDTGFAIGDGVGRLTGELLDSTDFAGENTVLVGP